LIFCKKENECVSENENDKGEEIRLTEDDFTQTSQTTEEIPSQPQKRAYLKRKAERSYLPKTKSRNQKKKFACVMCLFYC
jgi:hypothetical protein